MAGMSFYDEGVGRFLVSPGFGGTAAVLAGMIAYLAAVKKLTADQDTARKELTHEQRRDAYFALADVLEKAKDSVRDVDRISGSKYLQRGVPDELLQTQFGGGQEAALRQVQRFGPRPVREAAQSAVRHLDEMESAFEEWLMLDNAQPTFQTYRDKRTLDCVP
jgi:uncharacterized protein YdbL (DUF1318 family)